MTCSIEGLMDNLDQTISFTWKGPNGNILTNSTEWLIRSLTSDLDFGSLLTFNSLFTSHGGHYSCEASELNFDTEGTTLVDVHCMMTYNIIIIMLRIIIIITIVLFCSTTNIFYRD